MPTYFNGVLIPKVDRALPRRVVKVAPTKEGEFRIQGQGCDFVAPSMKGVSDICAYLAGFRPRYKEFAEDAVR